MKGNLFLAWYLPDAMTASVRYGAVSDFDVALT